MARDWSAEFDELAIEGEAAHDDVKAALREHASISLLDPVHRSIEAFTSFVLAYLRWCRAGRAMQGFLEEFLADRRAGV